MTTQYDPDAEMCEMNNLDLLNILADDGWEDVKDKSCASCLVVKKDGVTLRVHFDPEIRRYRSYSNPCDDQDQGTAVTYALIHRLDCPPSNTKCGKLGHARKILRPYLGRPLREASLKVFTSAVEEGDDEAGKKLSSQEIDALWGCFQPATNCAYATKIRMIPAHILELYQGSLACDRHGNLLMLHERPDGQHIGVASCGWERRGPNALGKKLRFSKGGRRSLSRFSRAGFQSERVVIMEAGIDCLSLAALEPKERDHTMYLSFGGNVTNMGLTTLRYFLDRVTYFSHNDIFPVELAHDSDAEDDDGTGRVRGAGDVYARKIAAALLTVEGPRRETMISLQPYAEGLDLLSLDEDTFWELAALGEIYRRRPPHIEMDDGTITKDWNDVLRMEIWKRIKANRLASTTTLA